MRRAYPRPMPESADQIYERAAGKLRTPPLHEWDSWPFEGDVRPKALERPTPERAHRPRRDRMSRMYQAGLRVRVDGRAVAPAADRSERASADPDPRAARAFRRPRRPPRGSRAR